MNKIPLRDINGKCEGECRNLVREAEEKFQREIDASGIESREFSRDVPWASSRNAPPGYLGGHV